ncbi:MAG: M15 family metallopeptidase [Tatlockia sp.]|jgi:hypothetical protein
MKKVLTILSTASRLAIPLLPKDPIQWKWKSPDSLTRCSKTHLVLIMTFLLITQNKGYPLEASVKQQCLVKAYPSSITQKGEFIKTMSGKNLVWNDGKLKSFDEMLNSPDLKDTLSLAYPAFRALTIHPLYNEDPGRFRHEPLMKLVYGNTEEEVRNNLISIDWLSYSNGKQVQFNKQNGAAQALKQVIQALEKLPVAYHKYFTHIGGTFLYRSVAGTHRLSAHAFGIAIDLNVQYGDYWRFTKNNLLSTGIPYKNRMPQAIIDIFERHCFIWGGRWYHYDTMHFEYRPELFCGRCVL